MSKTAPYIALAIDWWESDQFDDAGHGHRLAWVLLLCYGKAEGTGRNERKVSWNPERFAKRYRVDPNAARGMVDRAVSDNAVRVNGDELVILNWGAYQERGRKPRARQRAREIREVGEVAEVGEIRGAPSLINQSKPQSAALSGSDCLIEDSRKSACTPEQWLRRHQILDPLRSKVLALEGITTAELEREYAGLSSAARNKALVVCRRVFDVRGVDWQRDPRLSDQLQRIEAIRKRVAK